MSTQQLRVGLIGCGHIALLHARATAADPRLQPWAYADTRIEAARSFLRDHGGSYATADALDVISDDDVDIVVIATHHDSHAALAIAAAKAGRHILLEKPMATSVTDALAIEAAVQDAGVCFELNYKFRLERVVNQARNALRDPRLVIIQLAMPRIGAHSADAWVYDPLRGGGLVAGTGTHLLDLMSWMCRSEPVAVTSTTAVVGDRVDGLPDITVGSVEYASGAVGSVVLADVGDNPVLSKWSCQTYDGSQSVVLTDRLLKASFSNGAPQQETLSKLPPSMLAALADSTLDGTAPIAGARDGVRAVLLASALADSAALQQRITLD
jgi:predicted dehydrogenase